LSFLCSRLAGTFDSRLSGPVLIEQRLRLGLGLHGARLGCGSRAQRGPLPAARWPRWPPSGRGRQTTFQRDFCAAADCGGRWPRVALRTTIVCCEWQSVLARAGRNETSRGEHVLIMLALRL
jgi:hypothetical protein